MADTYHTPLPQTINQSWREVLDRWTEECLQCLWPSVHKAIDWSKPIEQLKWTAPEVSQGAEISSDTDLIYQASTSQQDDCLLWIHIVFKHENPEALATRLFQLSHQLYTYYQKPILPLVIALETSPDWQPAPYQAMALGYPTHRFEFQTAKLNDWLGKEKSLLSSDNLFENIMGIHLKTNTASDDPEERYQLKLTLHSDLLKRASTKENFLDLYTFMDQCIPLSETYNKRYHESIYELERKEQLNYLISAEQFGIDKWVQKGYNEGVEQARRQYLQRMLSAGIDRPVIKSTLRITDTELNRLLILENAEPNSYEITFDE